MRPASPPSSPRPGPPVRSGSRQRPAVASLAPTPWDSRRENRSTASSTPRTAQGWPRSCPAPRTRAAERLLSMTKASSPNDLSEAALALDRELRRFEDLADQAERLKLTTERSVERATEALTRAAESQDRIQAHVQQLVAAVGSARQKQEADAAALMARAQQIAARRKEFADVLQRMAALGQMAKEVQDALKAGPDAIDDLQSRMQTIADEAADIALTARQKEMEEVARQADGLRQQILAAKNKVALLAGKARV